MPTKIGGIKIFALKEINEQLGGYLLLPSDNILSKASSGDKSGMFLRKTSGIFLRETALRARSKPEYAENSKQSRELACRNLINFGIETFPG